MRFSVGHFYSHKAGRQIAVVGEVETYKWGKMLVIEEADKTGHAISTSETGQEANANEWTEIGKTEWLENFKDSACYDCGMVFKDGDNFVQVSGGLVHIQCFAARIKEGGPSAIVTGNTQIVQ